MATPTSTPAAGAEAELRRRWRELAGVAASGAVGDEVVHEIIARHAEPHRRYHTVTHVIWVLRHIDQLVLREAAFDIDAVIAAALFHDAVYDPRSSTNEPDSALIAKAALSRLGWASGTTSTVVELIEATAHLAEHGVAKHNLERRVLLDADLAILGAPSRAYNSYVAGVRAEYAHVGDAQWSEERAAVLHGLLARAQIFQTDTMFNDREQQARRNLATELQTLTPP